MSYLTVDPQTCPMDELKKELQKINENFANGGKVTDVKAMAQFLATSHSRITAEVKALKQLQSSLTTGPFTFCIITAPNAIR